MNSRNLPLTFFLTLIICSVPDRVKAQTPIPVAKARAAYDQCASLATSEDAAKAIAALKEKDPNARAQAAAQLGKSCDARAVEPLLDLLRDEDPTARAAAVEAIGRLGANESLFPLLEMSVNEKDWRVRLAMISSLASFKSVRARGALLNAIANPGGEDISDINDMYVRCSAILTINQFMDVGFSRKAILFLHGFLNSRHSTTRQMAEQTLYELKNTRNAAAEFRGLLKNNNNPELRRWTAEWMGKIGFENTSEVLTEAAANDPDPKVKQAASAALAALKNAK